MHNVPFSQAKGKLNEGDVLLFRTPPSFFSIGNMITTYTGGIHSHVGLVHLEDDDIYIVEQREFKGGRQVLLETQLKDCAGRIDVYRVSPEITVPTLNDDLTVKWNFKFFDAETARKVTKTAQSLTGIGYGWKNIWNIFKGYAPFLRFAVRRKNGDETLAEAYVCSTLVTYSYRVHYLDLCPNLKDDRTTPADIAQSSNLHYLFTIDK